MPSSFSNEHRLYLSAIKKHKYIVISARILLFVIFLAAWEVTTRIGIIDSFIFSSPSRIVKCFISLASDGTIFVHMWATIYETLICFSIVLTGGMLIAILMWRFCFIYEIADPYLVLLNSLPKSALAPVLIVWLGNNTKTIVVAAVSVAVFGAILSIYTGFMETDKEKIKLIQTLGGNKRHILFKLVIPSSVPTIINTMKVNLGLSLVGVIIGEFLAAKRGLGYLIIYGSQVFKMDLVLLSIVILCILSILLYQIIRIVEKKFVS